MKIYEAGTAEFSRYKKLLISSGVENAQIGLDRQLNLWIIQGENKYKINSEQISNESVVNGIKSLSR